MENELIYDASNARRVEWLWWFAAVLGVFFTVLGIVNKSLATIFTVAVIVGCVYAALRWRSMSVKIDGDDLAFRQFTRTERIPIATIADVGVTLPQLGTHSEAVFVHTGQRDVIATVTAFTRGDVDAEPLREALESHGWQPLEAQSPADAEPDSEAEAPA